MQASPHDNPTIPVRDGEALDWERLDADLKAHIEGLTGRPEISQFPGGNSNLTYRLKYPDHDLVVRRPPFGTRPKSGHSMLREFRVMNALKPVYGAVPRTYYHSEDETVIGAEFYVMARVPGRVVKQEFPPDWQFDGASTRRFCIAFWEKLIELHQVDLDAAGLGDFGKPEGYVERQIQGWNRRYRRARTDDVDAFEDVQEWLAAHLPETERAAILHGDFRIDNALISPEDPFKIVAILDWEISALGDPLMDLGNALAYWVQADDPPGLRRLIMQPSDAPGMLTRAEILELYRRRTGLDTRQFLFYQVYGYFRNAVILQQIYYRYHHGQTRDRRFARFGKAVMDLGRHCRDLIGGTA